MCAGSRWRAVALSRPYLSCSERFCSSRREIELSAGSMGAAEKTFDTQMQPWLRQQKNVLKETWYKYQETSATQRGGAANYCLSYVNPT